MMEQFDPCEVCAKCGGECCMRYPGAFFPQDIPGGVTIASIVTFVKDGKACFDWWEGDPRDGISYDDKDYMGRAYFLRPRVVGSEDDDFDPTWGGRCVHHTDCGCELSREEMPTGCKALEPKESLQCEDHSGAKRGVVMAWLEYRAEVSGAAGLLRAAR